MFWKLAKICPKHKHETASSTIAYKYLLMFCSLQMGSICVCSSTSDITQFASISIGWKGLFFLLLCSLFLLLVFLAFQMLPVSLKQCLPINKQLTKYRKSSLETLETVKNWQTLQWDGTWEFLKIIHKHSHHYTPGDNLGLVTFSWNFAQVLVHTSHLQIKIPQLWAKLFPDTFMKHCSQQESYSHAKDISQ